jgi:hypothetical protein
MAMVNASTAMVTRHSQFGRFEKIDATYMRRKYYHVVAFANDCILPPIEEGYLRPSYPDDYRKIIITASTHRQNDVTVVEMSFPGPIVYDTCFAFRGTWDEAVTFVRERYGITKGLTPVRKRKSRWDF